MKFIPQFEPTIKLRYIYAVVKQLLSGWIGTSAKTEEFENKIKEITGSQYAISTTSGSMALYLGIDSMNIDKSKKVLFPSYTFLACANVLKHLGYDVELVDVKLNTMCIDPDKIDFKRTDIGAIVFVNHNGYAGYDLIKVKQLCKWHGISLIEDSSQALGIDGAGTHGDFGVFSFSVPKLVTTGQGGVLFTNDKELATKAKQLRDQGDNWRQDKLHKFVGLNLKFNDILAAYGLSQLNSLPSLLTNRKKIFDRYRQYIELVDFGYDSTWMVIYETPHAEQIIKRLKENNIQAVQYYRPINENTPFNDNKKYNNALKIYNEYLYLPSSLKLTNKQIDLICDLILEVEDTFF